MADGPKIVGPGDGGFVDLGGLGIRVLAIAPSLFATGMTANVPDDIAVIGCDNLPVAELFTPRLTTIDVDMHELGTAIANTLHQILTTGTGPDIIPMPTPIVIERDST